jgi:rod shape-determining protein MreD
MIVSRSLDQGVSVKTAVKFSLAAFLLLSLQAQVVPQFPYPALRIDLFLPFMFVAAIEYTPFAALLWAGVLGFVVDVFSGEFWGLHVGSYIVAVCLTNIASSSFDWDNPVYQMFLVGLCALGQSIALGLFFSYVPTDSATLASIWVALSIRTVLCSTVAPLLIYPLLGAKAYGG